MPSTATVHMYENIDLPVVDTKHGSSKSFTPTADVANEDESEGVAYVSFARDALKDDKVKYFSKASHDDLKEKITSAAEVVASKESTEQLAIKYHEQGFDREVRE